MAKTVLSVDWDYFFEHLVYYDWGHSESELFKEAIWPMRCASRHLKTGEYAVHRCRPRGQHGFWKQVMNGNPKIIVITDSHSHLYYFLASLGELVTIDNFDAHHDCGYVKKFKGMDCGNWAQRARLNGWVSNYRLFYPTWRKEEPEDSLGLLPPDMVHYGTPSYIHAHYDIVFVCRSSAWCPSWADDDWADFVSHFNSFRYFKVKKFLHPFVEVMRHPTKKEAQKLLEKTEMHHRHLLAHLQRSELGKEITRRKPNGVGGQPNGVKRSGK